MESWCEMLRVSTAESSVCWSAASVDTNLPFWDTVQNDVTDWKSSAGVDFTCCNWVFAAILHKARVWCFPDSAVGLYCRGKKEPGDPEALVCCPAGVLQLCYKEATLREAFSAWGLGFQEENFLDLVWVALEDGKQRTHDFCIDKELQYWRDQWQQQQQWSWGQH